MPLPSLALQFCQGVDHALTQFCVRQSADAATHIVFEMLNIVRRRNGEGHRRMSDDPFQKKLRPGSALKFRREIGQRLSADRKSTRLNSSHQIISYAVFCL